MALYVMGTIISKLYEKKKFYFFITLITAITFYVFDNTTDISITSFSILLFLIIIKIPLQKNWINFFMPLTLGIYLVHPLVLKLVTKNYFFPNNILLIFSLVFILTVFCVFLIKKINFLKRIL